MLSSLYKDIIVKSFGQVKGKKKNFKEAEDTGQIVQEERKRGLLLTHALKMIIENHVEAIENTIPKCSEAGERQNQG
jgi:hypothetical protein